MRVYKVCLLGEFAVGKTSLVARFVHQQFSERYHTTMGVKVDTKVVQLRPGEPLKMVLWDIAGSDSNAAAYRAYVRGARGYLVVADGTRAETFEGALHLLEKVRQWEGQQPFVGLLNKVDLSEQWELGADRVEAQRSRGQTWRMTSAKTGAFVNDAFLELAQRLGATDA